MSSRWRDEIAPSLARLRRGRLVVVGVGNELRGDDGAGTLLARRLMESGARNVVEAGPVPENYCEPVARLRPEIVLIIDAARFGGEPGEARLIAASRIPQASLSTHRASLELFSEYLRARCGCTVVLLGIEASETGEGSGLSPPVRRTVKTLEKMLGAPEPRGKKGAGSAAVIAVAAAAFLCASAAPPCVAQPLMEKKKAQKRRERVLKWCKDNGVIIVGMTKEEVVKIYGLPDRRFNYNYRTGQLEMWKYNYPGHLRGLFPLRPGPSTSRFGTIYFKDGIVVDLQR